MFRDLPELVYSVISRFYEVVNRAPMMWGAAGHIFISGLLSQPENGLKFGAGSTAFFFLYYVFFGICWQVRSPVSRTMGLLHIGCSMVVPD
jgi:hypothetical protein